jgi:peptide/nickel transport system substrate-binding protein
LTTYTIDFVLKYPFPNLLFNLSNTAAGITWHGIYDEYGDDYGATHVVGTGPYMFEEWVRGDKNRAGEKRDYTWGPEWMSNRGPALIDKVILDHPGRNVPPHGAGYRRHSHSPEHHPFHL